MGAPPILQDVWQERQRRWGKEDNAYTYENGNAPLPRVDVFVYRASDDTKMTTFATIGVAQRPMQDSSRAELHCAVRGMVPRDQEAAIATELANLACFPWSPGVERPLDWGQTLGLSNEMPGFPGCSAVFLSGPFTNEGWSWMDAGGEKVRVINVVPITAAERAQASQSSPLDFIVDLMSRVDIFSPRP